MADEEPTLADRLRHIKPRDEYEHEVLDRAATELTRLQSSRDEVLEEAAKKADAHKGSAAKRRRERGQKLAHMTNQEAAEIVTEERGEDIAAGMIATAIRSLKSTREGEGK